MTINGMRAVQRKIKREIAGLARAQAFHMVISKRAGS
jgi:hypothetical protein